MMEWRWGSKQEEEEEEEEGGGGSEGAVVGKWDDGVEVGLIEDSVGRQGQGKARTKPRWRASVSGGKKQLEYGLLDGEPL